ncbi:hypothetical protein FB567DRAFT_602338 [Paraphoma chrysanthemicola]|uniref:C2H2-type domain-containing protein n=1 Tax=Paraphoma chrysanthemicola TaxID=798071 RepID=A0A8K0R760_9PLEO|nr:hypothetical protein FB567DRAFT_602338 [Paraphoma chrysanthemicola]
MLKGTLDVSLLFSSKASRTFWWTRHKRGACAKLSPGLRAQVRWSPRRSLITSWHSRLHHNLHRYQRPRSGLSRPLTKSLVATKQFGPCPFCATDACYHRPDDPVYDSTCLIPTASNALLENNYECSERDFITWPDDTDIAVESRSADRRLHAQHESVPILGIFPVEYLDFPSIDPSLLSLQVHEPQGCEPSVLDQRREEAFTESPRPQASSSSPSSILNMNTSLGTHQFIRPAIADLPISGEPSDEGSADPAPTSSSHRGTSPTASSMSSRQGDSDEAPDGKLKIQPVQLSLVCPSCREIFPSALRYRKHTNSHSCQTLSQCHDCSRSFKHSKDLKRHRGLTGSEPSCPALKASRSKQKRFTCTCGAAAYTRKDSLQRHIDRENARDSDQRHSAMSSPPSLLDPNA